MHVFVYVCMICKLFLFIYLFFIAFGSVREADPFTNWPFLACSAS